MNTALEKTGKRNEKMYTYKADVIKIIDGDTIVLNSEKIRFYGIDTPEIKQTCTDNNGQSYSCGIKATLELKKIIGSRKISCIKKTKDRYKRSISICYVDGKDINSLMVKKGWALAYRKYSKKYVKDEVIAKSNKAGMWSGDFIAPWKWRRPVSYTHLTLPTICSV